MIDTWRSPYQNRSYFEVAKEFGIGTRSLAEICFYTSPVDEYKEVAWEVSGNPQLAEGQGAYIFVGEVDPESIQKDSYYTIAKTGLDRYLNRGYSKRLTRVLQKVPVETELITPQGESDLNRSLGLFIDNEGARDFMDYEYFRSFVVALLRSEVATVFALRFSNDISGTLVALRSDSQINTRYYVSRREFAGSGHALLSSVIETEIASGTKIVDLSGYSTSSDAKMRGINEFKKQFGGTLIMFNKLTS